MFEIFEGKFIEITKLGTFLTLMDLDVGLEDELLAEKAIAEDLSYLFLCWLLSYLLDRE
jgi:hypothetical protein